MKPHTGWEDIAIRITTSTTVVELQDPRKGRNGMPNISHTSELTIIVQLSELSTMMQLRTVQPVRDESFKAEHSYQPTNRPMTGKNVTKFRGPLVRYRIPVGFARMEMECRI